MSEREPQPVCMFCQPESWPRITLAVKNGPWLDDDLRTPQGTAGYTVKK